MIVGKFECKQDLYLLFFLRLLYFITSLISVENVVFESATRENVSVNKTFIHQDGNLFQDLLSDM